MGPERAMVFASSETGNIVIQGGRFSPLGAASSLLTDVSNLVQANAVGFI
ncbi:hypothetical protein ACIQTZ_18830 [Paenarthrobacter sp. NPDC090520]